MGPLYIVTERFDPSRGEEWTNYIAWSGLEQLDEVVTLDSGLCPSVVHEIRDEDWAHIVNEDYVLEYFTELNYLLKRCGDVGAKNLLCVFRDPEKIPLPPSGIREFKYEGCDLVDVQGGISALTNCRGFPLAFSKAELSHHGLIDTLERAREAQQALKLHYPTDDHHSDCHVWVIFRAT